MVPNVVIPTLMKVCMNATPIFFPTNHELQFLALCSLETNGPIVMNVNSGVNMMGGYL